MAFLDNSGDIILDAVLTDLGRRRMAEGNFRITKFALGDDEIDYSLFDKNHPSGSAYYDLQIMQTPVFGAMTQIPAGINYGLIASTATDLLYMPVMKINELSTLSRNVTSYNGLFHIIDTSNNTSTSRIEDVLNGSTKIPFMNGRPTGNYVVCEIGIDTGASATPNGTDADRQAYLVATNLVDRNVIVSYDTRFISTILGPSRSLEGNQFNNTSDNSTLTDNFTLVNTVADSSNAAGIENYATSLAVGVKNGVVNAVDGTDSASSYSVIKGPRSAVTALSARCKPGLSSEYTDFGGTTTYNGTSVQFIDTTLYVQGTVSFATIQIPCRLVRLA